MLVLAGGESEINETGSINKLLSVNVQKSLQSEEYPFQVVSNDTPREEKEKKTPSKNSKTHVPDKASIFKQQQTADNFNDNFKNMKGSHTTLLIDNDSGDSGSLSFLPKL